MTDRDELVRRLRDKDQIVIGGLFYCIPVMREAATALSAQQPVGTVEEVTHAYGTKVKWARKMVAGEVLYTAPPAQKPVAETCQRLGCRLEIAQSLLDRAKGRGELSSAELETLAAPPPAPVSAEAIELAKLMLLPRYTDQDGKKVAAALLRVAGI